MHRTHPQWTPAALACLVLTLPVRAAPQEQSVADVAKAARSAVVLINSSGRTGRQHGIGSGFVVRADGIIATNAHVIGRGRPFEVQLADGTSSKPAEILAFDRKKDLALIKIEANHLHALPLGDSEAIEIGQPILAVGNPLGLKLSVTSGVVAEKRQLEGRPMIQVAMPIEPGSSGSPLLDRQGRVLGVVAIKSGTALGFAVPINEIKAMLAKPHPVKMDRWLTIGALDPAQWQPLEATQWRQRAGRIVCTGAGEGFGGRTLCLAQKAPAEEAFEVGVEVRLEDESGAAGLVFHSDGAEKHYGFYPTGGALRLTRFEGPDVFHWTVLATVPSEHYRPGQFNAIKVRVDGHRISCFVNDALVIEAQDDALAAGRVGLVKFREPAAEFRRFRCGEQLPRATLSDENAQRVRTLIADFSRDQAASAEVLDQLIVEGDRSTRLLRDRAAELEQQAVALRQLAQRVHRRRTQQRLYELLQVEEDSVDLLTAALLLAKLDNEDLEMDHYQNMLDRMAAEVRDQAGQDAAGMPLMRAMIHYLFSELGFHGSAAEYYHRSNSYLNEVLDDREGLPLTLSIVFIELARRLELPVVGIGLPGHFLVQFAPSEGEPQVIDVFNAGKFITREEASALTSQPVEERHFAPATKKEMIVRMLRNLRGVAQQEQDLDGVLHYLDVILLIDEGATAERGMRAALRYQNGQSAAALEDIDWLLEHEPPGIDLERVRQFRAVIQRRRP